MEDYQSDVEDFSEWDGQCPFCDSSDVECIDHETDLTETIEEYECIDCKRRFKVNAVMKRYISQVYYEEVSVYS